MFGTFVRGDHEEPAPGLRINIRRSGGQRRRHRSLDPVAQCHQPTGCWVLGSDFGRQLTGGKQNPQRIGRALDALALFQREELVAQRISFPMEQRLGRQIGNPDRLLRRTEGAGCLLQCALARARTREIQNGERTRHLPGRHCEVGNELVRLFTDQATALEVLQNRIHQLGVLAHRLGFASIRLGHGADLDWAAGKVRLGCAQFAGGKQFGDVAFNGVGRFLVEAHEVDQQLAPGAGREEIERIHVQLAPALRAHRDLHPAGRRLQAADFVAPGCNGQRKSARQWLQTGNIDGRESAGDREDRFPKVLGPMGHQQSARSIGVGQSGDAERIAAKAFLQGSNRCQCLRCITVDQGESLDAPGLERCGVEDAQLRMEGDHVAMSGHCQGKTIEDVRDQEEVGGSLRDREVPERRRASRQDPRLPVGTIANQRREPTVVSEDRKHRALCEEFPTLRSEEPESGEFAKQWRFGRQNVAQSTVTPADLVAIEQSEVGNPARGEPDTRGIAAGIVLAIEFKDAAQQQLRPFVGEFVDQEVHLSRAGRDPCMTRHTSSIR